MHFDIIFCRQFILMLTLILLRLGKLLLSVVCHLWVLCFFDLAPTLVPGVSCYIFVFNQLSKSFRQFHHFLNHKPTKIMTTCFLIVVNSSVERLLLMGLASNRVKMALDQPP